MEGSTKNNNVLIIVVIIAVVIVVGLLLFKGNVKDTVVGDVLPDATTEQPTGATGNTGGNTGASGGTRTETTGGTADIPPIDNLTVSYTNAGFTPFLLEVNAGDEVTFVNNSSGALWVQAINEPNTPPDKNYPEFNSGRSISPGGTYTFTFTKLGSWGYKNLNHEAHTGAIVVFPQKLQ